MARDKKRQNVINVLDNVHCLKLWRHTQSPPAGSKWIRHTQSVRAVQSLQGEFLSLRQWTLSEISHTITRIL